MSKNKSLLCDLSHQKFFLVLGVILHFLPFQQILGQQHNFMFFPPRKDAVHLWHQILLLLCLHDQRTYIEPVLVFSRYILMTLLLVYGWNVQISYLSWKIHYLLCEFDLFFVFSLPVIFFRIWLLDFSSTPLQIGLCLLLLPFSFLILRRKGFL